MSTAEVPRAEQSKGATIPRWTVPIYWAVGLLLVHIVIPWGISLLSARYGWFQGRPGMWNLLALLLVVAGITCIIWTMILHFVRAPQRVAWERTPQNLLRQGPYRFTRNPMYLAELMLWLGWALFYGSLVVFSGFLLLWGVMNFRIVPREERDLEARFGEPYLQYKSGVARWFGKPRL